MSALNLLITEPDSLSYNAKHILCEKFNVFQINKNQPLESSIGEVNGLFVKLKYKINKKILDRANRLSFIATPTTGLNHIDLVTCNERKIDIISLKGETDFLNTISATAEHTWGLLLTLMRNTVPAFNSVKNGHWNRNRFIGRELQGQTLGIIGFGRIGRMLNRYAKAFDMKVIVYECDDSKKVGNTAFVSLPDLLHNSDIISINASYSSENKNLIGRKEIERVKEGAFLVNTARGELLDENALLVALANGKLRGAALDVIDNEVGTGGCFTENHRLIKYSQNHDNLILSPHLGGCTYESMEKTDVFIATKVCNKYEVFN
ncbi:hypothetical protein OAL47_02500 [Verrucomicrobia bacterium]|nr:hypothetical protein [Verrucomicrobiota bacterium]